MIPIRNLLILTGFGILTFVLGPTANAHDSANMGDSSGSITNLITNYPDVYPNRYVKFGESVYTYQITFNDPIDPLKNQNCVLSLDGAPIKSGNCDAVITKLDPVTNSVIRGGGINLGVDGNYTLTVNGNALASWTFTRSPEVPPNPKPSQCIIKSVKPIIVKNRVMSLTIMSNGECTTDGWSYTFSGDPQGKSFAISNLGKNNYGKSPSSPLVMTKGSIVTLTYFSGDIFFTTIQKKFTLK